MSVVRLNVKWGKEAFQVNLNVSNGVKGLKADIEERTGVPADRMKIMPKSKGLWKGVLKDDFDLSTIDFAAAQSKAPNHELHVLLMGSATKLTAPKTKTVFLEDLPPEEAAKVAPEPSGLVNLGNTCYLNSVVQCLRAIPNFRNGLTSYIPGGPDNSSGQLMASSGIARNQSNSMLLTSLRDLYHNLDRTADAVPPSNFVMATKMAFPEFAQTGPQGQPMQQDAEEFYSGLLNVAANELEGPENIRRGFVDVSKAPPTDEELNGARNLVDAVFGIKMEETLSCDEVTSADMEVDVAAAPDTAVEATVTRYDLHRKLVCNIQGGSDASSQVNVTHIAEGINLSLNGKIEKHSEVLGRDAVWTRKQRMARLPPILVVQFGRFYWKATPDSQDHAGVKCKVMKPVAFMGTLDVFEFCTDNVKKVLKVARDKALAEEEDRIAKKLKGMAEEGKENGEEQKMETDEEDAKAGADEEATAAEEDEAAALQEALAMSMEPEEARQPPVGPGLPESFQGIFELFAVVTHKGRDADGGHYMGWVKGESNSKGNTRKIVDTDEDNEDWFVFDDDEVSPCKTEDVLKLKGGGDWHMSYMNFYRAKK